MSCSPRCMEPRHEPLYYEHRSSHDMTGSHWFELLLLLLPRPRFSRHRPIRLDKDAHPVGSEIHGHHGTLRDNEYIVNVGILSFNRCLGLFSWNAHQFGPGSLFVVAHVLVVGFLELRSRSRIVVASVDCLGFVSCSCCCCCCCRRFCRGFLGQNWNQMVTLLVTKGSCCCCCCCAFQRR